jgi:hypothetical protein
MAQRMEQLFCKLRAEMQRALAIQFQQANKSRRLSASLEVGDNVCLDAPNMATTRQSKNINWKHIGPYKVTEVISPWAYRIKLPSILHIHDVQKIFRSERAAQHRLLLSKPEPPPAVIVEREEEVYKVERVDDCRLFRKQLQYL